MTSDTSHQADTSGRTSIPRRPLIAVLAAVVGGLALDQLIPTVGGWGLILATAGWFAWIILYRTGRQPTVAAVVLLVSAGLLAAAWSHKCWRAFGEDEIGRFAREWSEPVCLRGRAVSAPALIPAPPFDPMRTISLGDQTHLVIEVDSLRDRAQWRSSSGNIDVLVSGHLRGIRPGDRVEVCGQLALEPRAANPGERDRATAARRDRVLCGVHCETPDCFSEAPATLGVRSPLAIVYAALADVRAHGRQMLWRYLRPRQAGLAAAVLLGEREEMPREEFDAYLQTGTIHLLVISGLHVTILAGGLFAALRLGWLSRRWGLVLIGGLTLFYTLLVDAQPPVVRATIVVLTFCVAGWHGRRTDGYNTLALAALVVVLFNPADLFRVGPQLSFLAVGTLIWWARRQRHSASSDPLDVLLAKATPWPVRKARSVGRWFLSLFLAGLAVTLVALPLTMHSFHLASVWSALLTPLLMPAMTGALLSGLGVVLFGWLLPPVAAACGWVCSGCLWTISRSVEWANASPASHAWVPGPALWWLAGFYAFVVFVALAPRFAPSRRWCVAVLCGWIAVGFGVSMLRGPGEQLRCTVLAVGHGSAAVLELPDGRVMVCDAGRLGSPELAARAVAGCLWSHGHRHIDAIVISHADADHYNAVPRLLTQFSVGAIYVSPIMLESKSHGVAALFDSIRQSGVPLRTTWAGEHFDVAPATIDVLHPPRKGVLSARPAFLDNANCIVLSVEYAGRRLLLPGDLETPGLEDFLAEEPRHFDFITAPHHGSRNNDPEGTGPLDPHTRPAPC